MKLIVDEMPYFSDDYLFSSARYDGVFCKLAKWDMPCSYLHPFKKREADRDRNACPFLMTLEEATAAQQSTNQTEETKEVNKDGEH